jgi:hypothetical protein
LEAFAGKQGELAVDEIVVGANLKRTRAREVERCTRRFCVRNAHAEQREDRDRCFSELGSHNCPVWSITLGTCRTAVPRKKRIYCVNFQNSMEGSPPAGLFATRVNGNWGDQERDARSFLVSWGPDRFHQSGVTLNN